MNTFPCTLLYICARCPSALFSLRQGVAVVVSLCPTLPSPDPEGSHGLLMPLLTSLRLLKGVSNYTTVYLLSSIGREAVIRHQVILDHRCLRSKLASSPIRTQLPPAGLLGGLCPPWVTDDINSSPAKQQLSWPPDSSFLFSPVRPTCREH